MTSAIDLMVQVARFSDGSRKITYITELVGLEGEQVTMQDIFLFEKSGVAENGKVTGQVQSHRRTAALLRKAAVVGHTASRVAVPDRCGDRAVDESTIVAIFAFLFILALLLFRSASGCVSTKSSAVKSWFRCCAR